MTPATTPIEPADRRAAAELRDQFGFLREIVAEMEQHIPYAAALATAADGVRLHLRDGEQQASRLDPRRGIVLTAVAGGAVYEQALSATDLNAVRAAARELVARVQADQARPLLPAKMASPGPSAAPRAEFAVDPGTPLDADFATPAREDPATVPLAEKLERFETLRQRARRVDRRVVQAMVRYSDSAERKVFVNRARFLTSLVRRAHVNISIVVADGHQQRYDWRIRGGTGGLEALDLPDAELDSLGETAVALLTARPVPPGMYEVVTDPSVSGVLAHEAFGHGVETDMFLKGRARGADYLGERVGSPLVTMMDDPTAPGGFGVYFFDDEGQRATPTCIIKDGILQRGLSDLYSATHLGIARSANGRRESFERKAYARMSNTFFAAGSSTPQELLESLDDGLLLCQASSGMEDPKGWGIQVLAHYAREYRGGRPTGVVYAPIAITGYVPDLLNSISLVANDLHLHPGTCGKGWKELVPVADGGPHLRTRARLG